MVGPACHCRQCIGPGEVAVGGSYDCASIEAREAAIYYLFQTDRLPSYGVLSNLSRGKAKRRWVFHPDWTKA